MSRQCSSSNFLGDNICIAYKRSRKCPHSISVGVDNVFHELRCVYMKSLQCEKTLIRRTCGLAVSDV